MPAYLIVSIDVHDPEKFNSYGEKLTPLIASFGGRYLVSGGEPQAVEGNLGLKSLVIIEFPSMEAARRFYDSPEYRPVKPLRLASASSDIVLVEGSAPSA